MIYELKIMHQRRAYRNGDLEAEEILEASDVFKTRKAGNQELIRAEELAKKLNHKCYSNIVKRGDSRSELIVYTGDTWQHENSGEQMYEYYLYTLTKRK